MSRPLVVVTGAAGGIGTALCDALARKYTVVGLDRGCGNAAFECIEFDLADRRSVEAAFAEIAKRHGTRIASVVHLAAFFDFTGEDNPLYDKVNVDGTRTLMRVLQRYEVEQLLYSGTMLVHRPCEPGRAIDEGAPIEPKWAYPVSKAKAEEVISAERGAIKATRLHLAGLYDESSAVPTLAHQIARIYERDLKSRLYSGDTRVGQSFVHRDDMIDAFVRAVDRRAALPDDAAILVGEPDGVAYQELQERIGCLIHGEAVWRTISVPKPVAKAGAWLEEKAEPVVPDSIDRGEKPFIRPFMVDMANDHYALDISRAREWLGWEPQHDIRQVLPDIIAALKRDPLGWYRENGLTPPHWLESAGERGEAARSDHDLYTTARHARARVACGFAAAVGVWLAAAPAVLPYDSALHASLDTAAGVLAAAAALAALARPLQKLRWAVAALGAWVLFAPLAFSTGSAAVYANSTLVGALLIGLSVIPRPHPGVSPAAALGTDRPPGWSRSPSAWGPRIAIACLSFSAFLIAWYMAAFQLGHVDGLWDPFFPDGSEAVTSSWISHAFPVSDAGLGAMVYLLEALLALTGTVRRWREIPWLVALFAFLVVPMGVVSVGFIIIQPLLLGTWCGLCLATAAATVAMIPLAVPELVATWRFLQRRRAAGRPLPVVFFTGDADDAVRETPVRVTPKWPLVATALLGLSLLFTRVTLGHDGWLANADHVIGSLLVTSSVIAFADAARWLRWVNVALGAALIAMPLVFGGDAVSVAAHLLVGLAVIALGLITRREE